MGTRVVNGNTFTEDGWPLVDQLGCTWITIPGTSPVVTIQVQSGVPATVLGALVADLNAFVQKVRDADTASWTEGNSVLGGFGDNNGSNHLGGSAVDVDWVDHPMGPAYAGWSADQIAAIRELIDWYEGTVFWGEDWTTPKDSMHFQMGYNTFQNPHTQDFIHRKVRADGFSTFRRGNAPVEQPLTRAERYALLIINEGRRLGITPRGNQIALAVGLVESNLTNYANSNDQASLLIPHDAVGSDHLSVGWAQQQPNWGSLADRMDITRAATLFFTCDNGPGTRGLTKIRERINGEDGDFYDYNDESHSPGFYAQKVQGSAFPDRYDGRFAEAVDLYNRLAATTGPPAGEDDLSAEDSRKLDAILDYLSKPRQSLSPFRPAGEGPKNDLATFVMYTDGSQHAEDVIDLAGYGHPGSLALLRDTAAIDLGVHPDRAGDVDLANAVLAGLAEPEATPEVRTVSVDAPAAPQTQIVYVPAPAVAASAATTTGQIVGNLYDALEAAKKAQLDLGPEGQAAITSLITALTTPAGVPA